MIPNEQNTRQSLSGNPENRADFYSALAEAQANLVNPTKDQDGYNYKYAGLDQVVEILRNVLPKHGICWWQNIVSSDNGQMGVETNVAHASGHMVSSTIFMPSVKMGNDIQGAGATLSYIRRYALTSFFGLASSEEDTDGNGDIEPDDPPKKEEPPRKTQAQVKREEREELVNSVLARMNGIDGEMERIASLEPPNNDPKNWHLKTLKAYMRMSQDELEKRVKKFRKKLDAEEASEEDENPMEETAQ